MRQLIFALAFCLTACATPTAHADPLTVDPDILRACVAQAGQDRAALEQCRGLITRDCTEAEGGANSITDVLCRAGEAREWQVLIQQRTAQIAEADPADGALLAAANNAWENWRDAECAYRAYEFGGGSGEQYDRVACDLELTAARAITLIVN